MPTVGADEDSVIEDSVFLAAMSRLPEGDLLLERIVACSNAIRAARKARWPQKCVAPLERDLINILEAFYRRANWYRHPSASDFPA